MVVLEWWVVLVPFLVVEEVSRLNWGGGDFGGEFVEGKVATEVSDSVSESKETGGWERRENMLCLVRERKRVRSN